MRAYVRQRIRQASLLFFGVFLVALLLPSVALADGDAIDPTSDLGMWSLLVGALLPSLVAVVQQPGWPRGLRVLVGAGASVVAGFVTTWLTESGALWDQGMVHAMLLVGVASWASYQSFWKPSKLATRIEGATALS